MQWGRKTHEQNSRVGWGTQEGVSHACPWCPQLPLLWCCWQPCTLSAWSSWGCFQLSVTQWVMIWRNIFKVILSLVLKFHKSTSVKAWQCLPGNATVLRKFKIWRHWALDYPTKKKKCFFYTKWDPRCFFGLFFVADKITLDLWDLKTVGMRCNLWCVLLISVIFSFFKTDWFTQATTDWMVSVQC